MIYFRTYRSTYHVDVPSLLWFLPLRFLWKYALSSSLLERIELQIDTNFIQIDRF